MSEKQKKISDLKVQIELLKQELKNKELVLFLNKLYFEKKKWYNTRV